MTFAPQLPWEQTTTRPGPNVREKARSKRTRGEDAVPVEGHSTKHLPDDFRKINGWGADLDPANRPSVPRELPSNVMTVRGDVKHWQTPRSKIHVSNEHAGITPVFGESVPPSGLSGLMRDFAYQYGEGTNRHWMMLLYADRVNIIESMIFDALRGKPDNVVRERGGVWAQPILIGAAAIGLAALLAYALSARED